MENTMVNTINEAIENEVTENATDVATNSGMSTAVAMLIGSGLTLATIAVVKKVKKVIANHKAKKELENEEALCNEFEAEYEDVTESEE